MVFPQRGRIRRAQGDGAPYRDAHRFTSSLARCAARPGHGGHVFASSFGPRSATVRAMREFWLGLISGVVLTAVTGWYVVVGRKTQPVREAQTVVGTALHRAVDTMEARLEAFELRGKDIKEDLERTGQVIRRAVRAAGATVEDATSDARITAAIKAKLVADRELSGWDIHVSTTDGVVTLSGRVATHEQVGRAMLLALETGGVREVRSTMQVKP